MLNIRFGAVEDTIYYVDGFFDSDYEDEWLEDPLVQEMIQDVDNSKVLSPHCIESPLLGQIPPTKLSGGVKALILMLKTEEEVWATACGDNCAKWITRIAEMKNLTICLEHFMSFGNNHFPFRDVKSGIVYDDYFDAVIARCGNYNDYESGNADES